MLFDWDDANIAHIALHGVTPEEAEQVLSNDPVDLSYEIVDSEERFGQAGETDQGRVLFVFSTFRSGKIRVITCFKPSRARLAEYFERKRSFYE